MSFQMSQTTTASPTIIEPASISPCYGQVSSTEDPDSNWSSFLSYVETENSRFQSPRFPTYNGPIRDLVCRFDQCREWYLSDFFDLWSDEPEEQYDHSEDDHLIIVFDGPLSDEYPSSKVV